MTEENLYMQHQHVQVIHNRSAVNETELCNKQSNRGGNCV